MYAIIETGGKQFRVEKGDVIEVERLNAQIGDKVELKSILKSDGGKIDTAISNVTAEVVSQVKGKKIVVYKYKSKKNIRKKQGHRQQYTKIKILNV